MVRNERRYWIVILEKGGKLRLSFLYSHKEREEFCKVKENHARPITMAEWKKIPKDMKV